MELLFPVEPEQQWSLNTSNQQHQNLLTVKQLDFDIAWTLLKHCLDNVRQLPHELPRQLPHLPQSRGLSQQLLVAATSWELLVATISSASSACRVSVSLQDFPDFPKTSPRLPGRFEHVSKCFKMFQDVSRCFNQDGVVECTNINICSYDLICSVYPYSRMKGFLHMPHQVFLG